MAPWARAGAAAGAVLQHHGKSILPTEAGAAAKTAVAVAVAVSQWKVGHARCLWRQQAQQPELWQAPLVGVVLREYPRRPRPPWRPHAQLAWSTKVPKARWLGVAVAEEGATVLQGQTWALPRAALRSAAPRRGSK